ncbi:MAG TPA: 16S rRNA methyltransferase [Chloroflexota bacterium]|nr:16S rRNA methyltransferase [Chloroflexota bacterium]
MSEPESARLASLTDLVLQSRKYRRVAPELVRDVAARELAKPVSLQAAVKATKNKLHQVAASYLVGEPTYAAWLRDVRDAWSTADPAVIRDVHWRIMRHHVSTRERLPILESFYRTILGPLTPVHSIIDVACGLNPLSIPWMPLERNAKYYAYDIYTDMMEFLQDSLGAMSIQGEAIARDVTRGCGMPQVDVALILKAVPCLDQIEESAASRLLESINARYLVVSFPVSSLGGRQKGMLAHYETRFQSLVANTDWKIARFEFPSELVFVIDKGRAQHIPC